MVKQWRASSDGPDWTDVRGLMRAMEGLNECSVSLTITCGGRSEGSELVINAIAMTDNPCTFLEPGGVGIGGVWPNPEGRTLTATIFHMIYKLDDLIEQEWKKSRNLA